MKLNIDYLYSGNYGSDLKNKLSQSGQNAISTQVIINIHNIHRNHYIGVSESLRRYRDILGQARLSNSSELEPNSPRLEYELICLVTSLLKSIPSIDIDKLLSQDPEVTEEDKLILKEAYSALNQKIDVLNQLLGLPCFARKKPEETPSN